MEKPWSPISQAWAPLSLYINNKGETLLKYWRNITEFFPTLSLLSVVFFTGEIKSFEIHVLTTQRFPIYIFLYSTFKMIAVIAFSCNITFCLLLGRESSSFRGRVRVLGRRDLPGLRRLGRRRSPCRIHRLCCCCASGLRGAVRTATAAGRPVSAPAAAA